MDEAGSWYSEKKLFSSGVVSPKSLSSKFLHPETTPTAVCGPKEHSQQGRDLCARQSCLMDRTLVSFSNGKSAEARGGVPTFLPPQIPAKDLRVKVSGPHEYTGRLPLILFTTSHTRSYTLSLPRLFSHAQSWVLVPARPARYTSHRWFDFAILDPA